MRIALTPEQIINNNVNKTSTCWLWTGNKSPNGYGIASYKNKGESAHRFVYKILGGTIPQGLTLHHKCEVRNCVNPAHLEPMTLRNNILLSKTGRAARNARKTHCPRGHELKFRKDIPKWRFCPECKNINQRERYKMTEEERQKQDKRKTAL